MNSENAVELRNIEMHFNMSKEKLESLKEYFLKIVSRKLKYEDFVALKSESACKEAGKMSVEGKEYVVQDGDIMHFRFNV